MNNHPFKPLYGKGGMDAKPQNPPAAKRKTSAVSSTKNKVASQPEIPQQPLPQNPKPSLGRTSQSPVSRALGSIRAINNKKTLLLIIIIILVILVMAAFVYRQQQQQKALRRLQKKLKRLM